MKVLISGARGLVGAAVTAELQRRGDEVQPLVRGTSGDGIWWEPTTGRMNTAAFEAWAPDAILHLAGESIAAQRWTAEQKRRIRESRVLATDNLVRTLRGLKHKPRALLTASAVGIYGNRRDEVLTEESPPGSDFLAGVARDWESAAQQLSSGTRVACLRFGMILSREGGALARMLPVFRAGAGGRLGSGKQWVSWISRTDVVQAIVWCLSTARAQGAYNLTAPNPVSNAEFTRVLAKVLHRPALAAAPAFALRLALGEMADALLLSSQRAVPSRLLAEGFVFQHSELEQALRSEFG